MKGKTNYEKEINRIVPLLPHKFQVQFALYCVRDVFEYIPDKHKGAVEATINLVETWLNGSLVTAQELKEAANAATNAATDAAYAANVTYAAAHAAHAAHAATNAATNAAYAATNAANATAYAANAANATDAAYAATNAAAYEKYHVEILRIIQNVTKLERVLYGLEYL